MSVTPGTTQTLSVTFLASQGGPPTDVTDATLTIRHAGAVVYGPRTDLTRRSAGTYDHDWAVPVDADPGLYVVTWSGLLPGRSVPSTASQTVLVAALQQPAAPDACWPVNTSVVEDWDSTDHTAAQRDYAVAMAGLTMRMLTGYRVGGCPVTTRPCQAVHRARTWRTYPVLGSGAGWVPLSLGGQWLNIGCGHDGIHCGCVGLAQVTLPQPVSAVLAVRIDGVEFPPSAYRLDGGGRLVRTDGGYWPLAQNMAADDTEPGTWSVTYQPGALVDLTGQYAAGILAGEYLHAAKGGKCRLPSNVQQIARQGITITRAIGAFPDGKTGLREVDAYVEAWNPYGLRTPSTVWSPDTARHRTQGRPTVVP